MVGYIIAGTIGSIILGSFFISIYKLILYVKRKNVEPKFSKALTISSILCFLLFTQVIFAIPSFSKMFADMGVALPLHTQIVLVSSKIFIPILSGIAILMTLLLVFVGCKYHKGSIKFLKLCFSKVPSKKVNIFNLATTLIFVLLIIFHLVGLFMPMFEMVNLVA